MENAETLKSENAENQRSAEAESERGGIFTVEEVKLIDSIRRQADAKAAAEKIIGKVIRPKQIRGRCCLFAGLARTTYYTGYTWAGAIARLIYLRKQESAENPELQEVVAEETRRSREGGTAATATASP